MEGNKRMGGYTVARMVE